MKPDPDFNAYHQLLAENYEDFNYGKSLSAFFMRKSHQLIEAPFTSKNYFERILEIGAGSGQHLRYVRHQFREYVMTDQSTAMLEQAKSNYPSSLRERITICSSDAYKLRFDSESFDRLIATHVLEHLYYPHQVLREWDRVVRSGGVLSIVLPCDPGLLWRLGRMLGPRSQAHQKGISYDYWMAREHVNPFNNLKVFIEYYFERVETLWYPSRIPSMDTNLFYICNVHK
ncbi:methyltransferase 24 [Crocosphaera chwakensis CCY0110]|uniref:Methyltransferase 24 n=2 Tax=Crocosphaera TaxID=263510 RepID=A3IQN4_9CHRO|nr:methyltransferase 24 [Crocosphaera chwakensis CCY0110]